jgi:hypothetical protein
VAEEGPMSALRILDGASNPLRANRIQVDVPDQFQQIAIRIHQKGTITSLKDVITRTATALLLPSVAPGNTHHRFPEGNITDLNSHMDMIRHPAVGMDPHSEMINDLGQQRAEAVSILRPEENLLTMIAAQDDVVKLAIHM